jgi:hypothetical protein
MPDEPLPPGGLGFRVRKVPLSYADQVQLSAVLRPVAVGHSDLRDSTEIARQTAWLRWRWRLAATRLAEAGWGTLGATGPRRSLGNALVCPVAFVMTMEKKGRTCNLFPCPFCWARQVREQWLALDALFFPPTGSPRKRSRVVDVGDEPPASLDVPTPPTRSPYGLLERVQTFRIPATVEVTAYGMRVTRPALGVFLESRTTGKPDAKLARAPELRWLLRRLGTGAGLIESIRYRPSGPGARPWIVEVRQLALVPEGVKPPAFRPHRLARGPNFQRFFPAPRRKLVCGLVARTLRYMPDLLGDVEVALAMLNAREGRRLVASFGVFRSHH